MVAEVIETMVTKEMRCEKFGLALAPIVKPTTGVAEAAFSASSGTAVNDNSTFGGYTIQQIVKALQNLGLLT